MILLLIQLMAFTSGTWKMNSSATFNNSTDHSQYERLYIAFVNLKIKLMVEVGESSYRNYGKKSF